jgi:general stress protein 26
MPHVLEPRVRSLLETVPVGVIATQRRDGRARQSTVYFVLDGDTIWISTEAARAKVIDVGRSGWASLCVVSPSAPFASVTVEGRASVQATGIAQQDAQVVMGYCRKLLIAPTCGLLSQLTTFQHRSAR